MEVLKEPKDNIKTNNIDIIDLLNSSINNLSSISNNFKELNEKVKKEENIYNFSPQLYHNYILNHKFDNFLMTN